MYEILTSLTIITTILSIIFTIVWKVFYHGRDNNVLITPRIPRDINIKRHINYSLVTFGYLFASHSTPGFSYLLLVHRDFRLSVLGVLKYKPSFYFFASHINSYQSEDGSDNKINALVDLNLYVSYFISADTRGFTLRILEIQQVIVDLRNRDLRDGYRMSSVKSFMYSFCMEANPNKIIFH